MLHQLDVKKADKDSIQEEMNVVSLWELEERIFSPTPIKSLVWKSNWAG